jgi:hypothetical protein
MYSCWGRFRSGKLLISLKAGERGPEGSFRRSLGNGRD